MSRLKIQRGLANRLMQLVHDKVTPGKPFAHAEDRAYKKAAKAVRDALRKKYPPGDMAVLAKYKLAVTDECIKLALLVNDTQEVVVFKFRDDDGDIPQIPARTDCRHWHSPVHDLGQKTAELVSEWEKASEALDIELSSRRAAYQVLIESSNAKEIAATWPEAAPVIEAYKSRTLPAPVTKSVLDTIKADMAERGVKA